MEIVKYPNTVLRRVSDEVSVPVPPEDKNLLNELFSYVKEHSDIAVGLSAIQVGIPKRLCAIRFTRNGKTVTYKLVNPKIIWHSQKKIYNTEGCLSVEDSNDETVGRWESVKVSAFDTIQNKYVVINASGLESIILQHEIDHMDGKLYIDYIR
jgi:peptide deformylase